MFADKRNATSGSACLAAALARVLFPSAVRADDSVPTPRAEVSAGFAWMSAQRTQRQSMKGVFIDLGVPVKPALQLLFSIDLQRGSGPFVLEGEKARHSRIQALAGPEYTRRNRRTTLFAHLLIGVAEWELTGRVPAAGGTLPQIRNHVTALAMAFGGGVDVNLTEHLAVHVIQADYILTRFKDDSHTTGYFVPWPFTGKWQSTPRVTFGMKFRFGR